LKGTILVIDDNKQLLYLIENILKIHGYQTILAQSGEVAIELLEKLVDPPDLILCDIMLPGMDGYELFHKVTDHFQWFDIPFVFLSAKSDPDDIRFGKSLGVDDYITKPFKEEDLMAIIEGKIARCKRYKKFKQKLQDEITEKLSATLLSTQPSFPKESVFLLLIKWHDVLGPQPESYYPKEIDKIIKIDVLGVQLFQIIVSVYGELRVTNPHGVPLYLENIGMSCFVYIDAYQDLESLSKQVPFILVVIAPKLDYLVSQRLEEILKPISCKIRNKEDWDIQAVWNRVVEILPTI